MGSKQLWSWPLVLLPPAWGCKTSYYDWSCSFCVVVSSVAKMKRWKKVFTRDWLASDVSKLPVTLQWSTSDWGRGWMLVIGLFLTLVPLLCFVSMLFFLMFFLSYCVSFFLSISPTPKWVSGWLPLVPPQANTFFVLLLLCCLKSSTSGSDGCLKTCRMLPIVSTISNSNRSTRDKVVLGFLWIRRGRCFEGFCHCVDFAND